MTDRIVVFTTCGSPEEAGRIARMLVERQLAACVTIAGPVQSIYRWQGKMEQAYESVLTIKTTEARFPELRDALRAAHSYQVPEIISLPILDGLPEYLAWLGEGNPRT